ncbi:hypothetical protein ACWCXX_04945 [Streptomyces sp. NPDC001732]
MADERYEWLDKEAAERLLRGEPVDPVGGHPCTEAEKLVAALDAAARSARPATGELPGEAAALAAFRTATRSARDSARVRKRAGGAEGGARQTGTEVLPTVRIRAASGGSGSRTSAASGSSGRIRRPRWSRPVRFGLVASFAGCALGGVAVAAGTGMFPGPFGDHAPMPATSVSAAATPEELGSGPTAGETPRTPSSDPDRGASESAPNRSTPSGRADGDGSNRRDARKPGSSVSGSPRSSDKSGLPEYPGKGSSGAWYAKALKACRDYRNGNLDDDRRRNLETLAKGARNLDRFCDRVIEGSDKDRSEAPGSDNGGSGDGDQDDDGQDDGAGDGGGTVGGDTPADGTVDPSPTPSPALPSLDDTPSSATSTPDSDLTPAS